LVVFRRDEVATKPFLRQLVEDLAKFPIRLQPGDPVDLEFVQKLEQGSTEAASVEDQGQYPAHPTVADDGLDLVDHAGDDGRELV